MSKILNKRVIRILAIIGIICLVLPTIVFAAEPISTDIWGMGSNFINKGKENETINFNEVWTNLKPIAQIVMGIGLVVLVCVGTVLGVKYMIAGADDKAKVKQKLVWFCVAAALVVGATGIFNIVVEVASNFD